MSGQEVKVKEVEWLKRLLDDDDESDSSGNDTPPPKTSVAAPASSAAPETQAEPQTEADEPNGRLVKKRPERSTQRERTKKEKADEESREPKAAEKPKRTTRKRPLPTESKAEKDGAKEQPKGRKKPADASAASAETTRKSARSAKPKRMEGSDVSQPKQEADEQQPETQVPLVSPASRSAKKPKREAATDSKDQMKEPVDALIEALEKPARVKKELDATDGAIDGERPQEARKKTPEKRMEVNGRKKRMPPVDGEAAKRSDRRSGKAKRMEDNGNEQEAEQKKPQQPEAPVPSAKRPKVEAERKKRASSSDEKMANTLKDLSKAQAKAKASRAEATEKPTRVKTDEKRVRRLPKREKREEATIPATEETKKELTPVKSEAKEEKPEAVNGTVEKKAEAGEAKDEKAEAVEIKEEKKTEPEEAEKKPKEEQTKAPGSAAADSTSDVKVKEETREVSGAPSESKATEKEEAVEEAGEGEEGEEPEDGAVKKEKTSGQKTEAASSAGEAPVLMDPLSFVIPKKKFSKDSEPRRPPPLPVNTTTVPSPGARQPIPSRSPSASPVAVEALPVRNAKPRTKNVVPVKSVPVTPQEREFMRLARKKNSFFTAASAAPLTPSNSSPYSIVDGSGKIVPDLMPRMKCPTKKRMKTETQEFPHAFFGVSMATPPCVADEKTDAASCSSAVNCYEQLQFQQRDDLEAYERKLYGTAFVPQYLRARRTLIMRNARYERKSSGLRFNTHRDREDFEAKLSARYKINKSVPRCEIPPKNWQLIMNQRPANIFLHYQHIEDAALAAARFVDDRGESLVWKGPGPAPALLGSSASSNSIGRSPAPSPSTTPQPLARPGSTRRRPRTPPRRGPSPARRERLSDRGIARENRFNRPGDPYPQDSHRRQEDWGPRDGRDAQYAPPRRQSMDDRLGLQMNREPANGRPDRPRSRSRSRSRSIAIATDDSQGTSSEPKPVSDAPETKSEKEGSVNGSHRSSEAMAGDGNAPVSEAKDIRHDQDPRRNEEEFRRDRGPSQDHAHYAGYESGGSRRMEEHGWRNDREGRDDRHQNRMDESHDRGRTFSRDWGDRRNMRMNEGDEGRERSRSRPRSFDHGREGPPPPHGNDHGQWHGGDRNDHGRPHDMDRFQDNQRHRNPDMGMYGPGGDGAGDPPHDRPRSGSRDRRHRGGSGRRNRNGGSRRF